MKHIFSLSIIVMSVMIISCNNKSRDITVLEKERDSLRSINSQQQMILDDMTSTMASISMSLDTIAMHESMIIRRVDEEGNPLSRKQLKSKLETLTGIIESQREKMSALEKDMNDGKSSIAQLKSIIVYLNASLEQKEIEIKQLRSELSSKNISIARLNSHVSNLRDTVDSVRQENEEQRHQLKEQDVKHDLALNIVYYVIGTKDQLTKSGILSTSGTIFKKSKINFASIDKSVLTKADKRLLKRIDIHGKSPKILSDEPNGSYTLEKGTSVSTLTIHDSEKFWNTNNKILVIQIK